MVQAPMFIERLTVVTGDREQCAIGESRLDRRACIGSTLVHQQQFPIPKCLLLNALDRRSDKFVGYIY